jgi:hypothetical protein
MKLEGGDAHKMAKEIFYLDVLRVEKIYWLESFIPNKTLE